MIWLRDNNTHCVAKKIDLVGQEFTLKGRDYVVTWNTSRHIRATPLDCPTGLTSCEFMVDELVGKWKPKNSSK